jgi:hypothetical protein
MVGGDLYASGMITKSSGSFKIDHPLDPANKYLSHSFVESPDMMNIYNGVVDNHHSRLIRRLANTCACQWVAHL